MITRAIEIECLPDEIPEQFVVDVTELMIGQSKRASDVALTGSMKLVSSPETVIAHAVALRAEEVAAPAEAAAVRRSRRQRRRRARSHQEGQEGRGSRRRTRTRKRARRSRLAMFLVAGLGNPGEEYAAHAA